MMPLEQPVRIEPLLELEQCLPQFPDGVEGPHPQQLLFRNRPIHTVLPDRFLAS